MALIITSTEQKKLLIKGTEIELASIYLRIDFVARANGVFYGRKCRSIPQ